MASWQRIQSHTVAGPRRPLTDFPVQPNGFLSVRSISNAFGEAVFDPRKERDRTLAPSEVKLPGVSNAEPPGETSPRQRITQQILPARVEQVIDAEAQTQPRFEQVRADPERQHRPGRQLNEVGRIAVALANVQNLKKSHQVGDPL